MVVKTLSQTVGRMFKFTHTFSLGVAGIVPTARVISISHFTFEGSLVASIARVERAPSLPYPRLVRGSEVNSDCGRRTTTFLSGGSGSKGIPHCLALFIS
jgi:hypothetical protein